MANNDEALTWKERRYSPLTNQLWAVDPNESAMMTFGEIERVIGGPLPAKAREDVDWWWSIPRTPQGRAWLRADRRAEVDILKETTTFVFAVFKRGRSIEEAKRMRNDWLGSARRALAASERPHNVERGWWEPHFVYLIHFPAIRVFKVGLTRVGSTRVSRLAGRDGRLVDLIEVANRWSSLVVEHHVLELAWDAWEPPARFATGDKGETERWSDWLVPPPLSVVGDSLEADRLLPGWGVSVFRKES